MLINEKSTSGEYLLSVMQNPDVKAYLLFLKHILNYLNSFNAFFQAAETIIYFLQPKSVELLTIISKHFLKPELLNVCNNVEFSNKDNQKYLNKINLGDHRVRRIPRHIKRTCRRDCKCSRELFAILCHCCRGS